MPVRRALLRAATFDDLDEIMGIEAECFGERQFRRDHVTWILGNPRAGTLVEPGDRGLLGAAMLLFERDACRVLSVAVRPSARRRGLGTEMMLAAESAAWDRGNRRIRLEVSTANFGAIEFYRRLGYKTDGVLYGYYSWGEDAYSMAKAISEAPQLVRPLK